MGATRWPATHFRVLLEFRRGVDHPKRANQTLHPVEGTQLTPDGGQDGEGGEASGLFALLGREVGADAARHERAVWQDGRVTREMEEAALSLRRKVQPLGNGRVWKCEAQGAKPRLVVAGVGHGVLEALCGHRQPQGCSLGVLAGFCGSRPLQRVLAPADANKPTGTHARTRTRAHTRRLETLNGCVCGAGLWSDHRRSAGVK